MQLTNPEPPAQALWDWKYHIRFAYEKVLLAKLSSINNYLKTDLAIVDEWNEGLNREFDQVEKLDTTYGGIRWKIARSVLFGSNYASLNSYFDGPLADGERSFLDACAMLAYNGFGGTEQNASNGIPGGYKNFVFLKRDKEDLKPYWTIRDNSQNYVRKVSTRIVPQ